MNSGRERELAARKRRAANDKRTVFKLFEYLDDPHCRYCGVLMLSPSDRPTPGDADEMSRQCTVDHRTPLKMGGADNHRNWAICCWKCNQTKGCGPRWMTLAEILS